MGQPTEYYQAPRPDLLRHIQAGDNRILDVGCAEGVFSASLKQLKLAAEVVGIERFPDAAAVASEKLDQVICGDLESMDFSSLEPASFDYIICGDVLEHLRDPWRVLKALLPLLKNTGRIIVSVPNVRHWSVLLPLLFSGQWQYQSQGILDKTHLRFFTRKSARQMVADAGLQIESCQGSRLRRKKDKLINALLLGLGTEFVSAQWIFVGKPV